MPKGSFYHHFESKEDFGLQAIDLYIGGVHGALEAAFGDDKREPLEQIRHFFAMLSDGCKGDGNRGCLMEVPLSMVFLSTALDPKASRIPNIGAGAFMTVVQSATLFVGKPTSYYLVSSVAEIATMGFISVYSLFYMKPPSVAPAVEARKGFLAIEATVTLLTLAGVHLVDLQALSLRAASPLAFRSATHPLGTRCQRASWSGPFGGVSAIPPIGVSHREVLEDPSDRLICAQTLFRARARDGQRLPIVDVRRGGAEGERGNMNRRWPLAVVLGAVSATIALAPKRASACCDPDTYQWEKGGACVPDPCKKLGDHLLEHAPTLGRSYFIGCEPTKQRVCPIYIAGVGSASGILSPSGKRFPGCHYATEPDAASPSFLQAKWELSDPFARMKGTFEQSRQFVDAVNEFASPVLCHSWGTGTCAANLSAYSGLNVSYFGGACPVGGRCNVNQQDVVPGLIHFWMVGNSYDLATGPVSRFVTPPFLGKSVEPHYAYHYFDPTRENPGFRALGPGWNVTRPMDPVPVPEMDPGDGDDCGPPLAPPKPNSPNRPSPPMTDPPYAGPAADELPAGASSCAAAALVAGPRVDRDWAPGALVVLGLVASRRRRRGRALTQRVAATNLLSLLLVMLTGAACSSSPADSGSKATKQALIGQVGCANELTNCMTDCTLGEACSGFCRSMVARCCVPFDVTGHSLDSGCALEEWLLRAGLKNSDGTNASCGVDRDCDGRDDCNGVAVSLCCGDADCDGKDDCTANPTTDARCPTPCGDANCDGRDDCNPKLVSTACNAAFGAQVGAICAATSSRIAGRIGAAADVDVYAVAAAAGQSIHVDINARDVLQSALEPVVRLTDAGGATLASGTYTLGADQSLDVTAGTSGSYYVWVAGSPDTGFTGAGASQGEYTLGVTVGGAAFTASPRGCADAGNTIATAQPLVAAATVPAASSQSSCAGTCGVPVLSAAATMVLIPAGTFRSGCGDRSVCYREEAPVQTWVSEFLLDRTEVTQSAYKQCIDAAVCTAPATTTSYFDAVAMPQHPVVDVTWFQAAQYCKWAGKRLPTEAEWEKAARGLDGRRYPWGSLPPSCSLANANNCNTKFQAVGSHPTGASPYGVLDMAGNVAEWVHDWYDQDYRVNAPARDPAGPGEAERFPWYNRHWKVTRGGSFSAGSDTLDDNTLDHLRTTRRSQLAPDAHSPRLGFRCAAAGPACVPRTCAESGQCGVIPDGCGGTIDCGGCAAPASCGGGGTPNFCGCTPSATVDCGSTWSRRFGYNAGSVDLTHRPPQLDLVTALDASDNLYLLTTVSAVTVNIGGADLAPIGTNQNVVLARYDSHGRHAWSIRLGSTGSTSGHSLALDGSGNVYVTGNFTGTTNLGGSSFTSAGSNDVFVAKFAAATGAHAWSKRFGSTGDEYSFGIAADSSSGLYLTGYYTGTGNFGGANFTSTGSKDIFVVRLSVTDGSPIWSKSFGSTGGGEDYGIQVRVDASGNAVIGGHYNTQLSFGGSTLTSAGGMDIFLAKLSPAGAHVSSMRAGGTANERLTDFAISSSGDIAVTGEYELYGGSANFGGSDLPDTNSPSLGSHFPHIFAAEFTGAGTHVWSRGMGSAAYDGGRDIAFTASGNVVLLAQYALGVLGRGPVDAGGGLLPYLGYEDILLAEYDGATGAHVWSKSLGGDDIEDVGRGLAIASTGELVLAARPVSTVNFGGGWLTGPRTNSQIVLSRLPSTGPCRPLSCAAAGAECGTISDGCGGTLVCGTCQGPETCGVGGPNKCGCSPATCSSLGANCGQKLDGCGSVLTCSGGPTSDTACANNHSCVEKATSCASAGASCGQIENGCDQVYSCGTCSGGLTCGGGGVANACGSGTCTPKTCAQLGKNCGKVSDGCAGVLDCGTCATGTCGGGGTPNVCGVCVAKTCTQLGKNCGAVDDGCGNLIECGTCSAPQVCGGAGPGVCGCVMQTCEAHSATCGSLENGCGGTLDCGTCSSGSVCGADLATANQCCMPKSCVTEGKNCGTIADGCGHLLDCGSCSSGQTCGGGGSANVCGCKPKTCAEVGANCGAVADGCGGTLSCGSCVAPNVCGPNNTCTLPWPAFMAGTRNIRVAADTSGNIVVAGSYFAPTTFSPDKTVSTGTGIFVAKYAPTGSLLWVKSFVGGYSTAPAGLALDGAGDIVVTGVAFGSCDFGGGMTTTTSTSAGLFVAKYAGSDGAYQWANRFNGTTGTDSVGAAAVATDPTGGVVVTGTLWGSAALGGATLTSTGSIFVARYQGSNGSHLWSTTFDGSASAIATDGLGNIFLTGSFGGSINFGTKAATKLASAGDADIFVAKLTSAGAHTWSKRLGSTGADHGSGIAVSSAGVVAVTGDFRGVVDFGGGPLTSAGSSDIFVESLDGATGAYLWARRFGDASSNLGRFVTFSGSDRVVVGGTSTTGLDFGGGVLPHAACACDAYFVAGFATTNGAYQWAVGGYDANITYQDSLALDGSGKVYLGGYVSPGSSVHGAPAPSTGLGGFVLQLNPAVTCTATTCSAQGRSCGSIPDGCGRSLNCGTCTSPSTCGYAGSCCAPTTCAVQGKNCGTISDGCGGTLSCGTCTEWPQTCGGGGAPPNVCGGIVSPTYWSRDVGPSSELATGLAVASDGTVLQAVQSSTPQAWTTAFTPSGDQQWTLKASGGVTSVATDDSNHAYMVGADLDPYHTFLMRYSSALGTRWTQQMAGGTIATVSSARPRVATRGTEVVVGLTVTGTTDLGGGPLVAGTTTATDVVVAKYRRDDGGLVWAKRFGGTDGKATTIGGVAIDASGNVYVAGKLKGTVSFGGSPLSPSSCGTYDDSDVFLVKLAAANGAQQWATQVACNGTSAPEVYGLGAAEDGKLVLLGNWSVEARSGATGTVIWSKNLGSNTPFDVAFDSAGNPIVAGLLNTPFDLGGGSIGASSGSSFAVKYVAATGAHLWSRAFDSGHARLVALDTRPGAGAVLLAGVTGSNPTDFQVFGGPVPANRSFVARLAEPSVACTPNCTGKTCGSDGCGGSCGTCSGTGTCAGTCSTAGTCDYPATNISCSDSNACTSGDRCNGAGSCVATTTITTCSQTSDACCPTGCTASNDTNCGYCGDAICSCSEKSSGSCPGDCKKTGKNAFTCGNATCEIGETATTCPADCGGGCP